MSDTPIIYGKMAAILKALEPIPKQREGDGIKYKFRGVDDAMTSLNPLLAEHGVICIPQFVDQKHTEYKTRNGAVMQHFVTVMSYRFYAEDGSFVEGSMVGEGSDTGDKASNKSIAGAYKYMIFQTFCIPTEEKKDSEYENPELGSKEPETIDESASKYADIKADMEGCGTLEELQRVYNDCADSIKTLNTEDKDALVQLKNELKEKLSIEDVQGQ